MSKGLGGVVNQAHLIHDQSAGRSSTRLHAPPGGRSAMGSSFAWGPEESAPLRSGRGSTPQSLRHLAGSGVFSVGDHAEPPATAVTSPLSAVAGVDVPRAPEVYQLSEAEATDSLAGHQEPPCPPPISDNPRRGFGDSGNSSIRVHSSPGGLNAMGSGFAWSEEPVGHTGSRRSADAWGEHLRAQQGDGAPKTAFSRQLQVGSHVTYKQVGKAGIQSAAVIVEIEPAAARRDNYRIRFEDGRERNTTIDRLSFALIG